MFSHISYIPSHEMPSPVLPIMETDNGDRLLNAVWVGLAKDSLFVPDVFSDFLVSKSAH